MNNVNTLNDASVNQKKSSGLGRLSQVLALCTILSVANPTEVNANNVMNGSMQNMEVVQNYDIINNIQRRTGTTLPSIYAQKFNNFVLNSKILRDRDAQKFTEDFIVKQMQSNRGISKQNQLLFIWDAVYEQITGKNVYTGEDGNNKRLAEFENVMDIVEQCGKNYNSGFKTYMRQRSADADRRSADADRRSADADRNIVQSTINSLNELNKIYNLYRRNPGSISESELIKVKKNAKYIIQNCKQYGIDYKTKLSPEVRRFYGID